MPVNTNGPAVLTACSTSLELGSIVTVVTDSQCKNGVPVPLPQCRETEDCVESNTNAHLCSVMDGKACLCSKSTLFRNENWCF